MLNVTRTPWVPFVTSTIPGDLSVSYSNLQGWWAQSGGVAQMGAFITFTPTYTTASGAFLIGGWPVTPLFNPQAGIPADLTTCGQVGNFSTNIVWPAGATMLSPRWVFSGQTPMLGIGCLGLGVSSLLNIVASFVSGTPAIIGVQATVLVDV